MAFVNLASYKSPGVYVQEIDSGIKAITGVSTSTTAFIGVLSEFGNKTATANEKFKGKGDAGNFLLKNYPVITTQGSYRVTVDGIKVDGDDVKIVDDNSAAKLTFKNAEALDDSKEITISYEYKVTFKKSEDFGKNKKIQTEFEIKSFLLASNPKPGINQILDKSVKVFTDGASTSIETDKITISDNSKDEVDPSKYKVVVKITDQALIKDKSVTISYQYMPPAYPKNTPILCTSFGDFKNTFFDLSVAEPKRFLAQAVFGFFNNGGSRCYIVCTDSAGNIEKEVLPALASIDEVALVAAPGQTEKSIQQLLINHCAQYEGIFRAYPVNSQGS
ncbi:hypothetical protein W03_10510 [Nitrosomonas sp. PY1]|uniref:hypothetical protein n=1 Tax=Nitrosomonas sp. PY1 TaxID=1803906 RepID=UPI001FC80113|nr:hypothetical protein [Nitrosomonas sp. PY1]GKS69047.1 hypothetical protein W03_10510 [Nitrosomonas sp. PY1]